MENSSWPSIQTNPSLPEDIQDGHSTLMPINTRMDPHDDKQEKDEKNLLQNTTQKEHVNLIQNMVQPI